jgi:hypothetical protein
LNRAQLPRDQGVIRYLSHAFRPCPDSERVTGRLVSRRCSTTPTRSSLSTCTLAKQWTPDHFLETCATKRGPTSLNGGFCRFSITMHESGCWHPALRTGTDEPAVGKQPRAHIGKQMNCQTHTCVSKGIPFAMLGGCIFLLLCY